MGGEPWHTHGCRRQGASGRRPMAAPSRGGAPRAVWLTLGTGRRGVGAVGRAAAGGEHRPCHLIWNPITGDVVQLISVLRAGRALGAPDQLDWTPGAIRARPKNVNAEGRVCVQIGVLGARASPSPPAPERVEAVVGWLDSWGVPRRWPPAGRWRGAGWTVGPASAGLAALADQRSRGVRSGRAAGTSAPRRCPGARTRGPAPSTPPVTGISGPHGLRCGPRLPSPRAEAAALGHSRRSYGMTRAAGGGESRARGKICL